MKWTLKCYQRLPRCQVRDQYDRQCSSQVALDIDGNYDPEHMCEAHRDLFEHWTILLSPSADHR